MIDCFENIVALRGCSEEKPTGGYVDDIYINKALLAQAIDGLYSVTEWFEMKLEEVVDNVIIDIKSRLELDVRTNIQTLKSSTRPMDDSSVLTLESSGFSKILLTILDIRCVEDIDTPNFYLNGELTSFEGPITIEGYNFELQTECEAIHNSLYEDSCCKPCNEPCSITHSKTDGGFKFEATLVCDFEGWLCQFRDLLIPLIKHQMRVEIAVAMQSSGNISIGTFTSEEADLVIYRNEKKYERVMKSILKTIRSKANDDCCFDCSRFSHDMFLP